VSITALFGLYGYTSPTPAPGSTYGQYFSITCITDRCVPYRRHRYHPVRTWHRDCGTRRGRRGLLTAPTSPWGNKSMPRPPRHTWSLAAPLSALSTGQQRTCLTIPTHPTYLWAGAERCRAAVLQGYHLGDFAFLSWKRCCCASWAAAGAPASTVLARSSAAHPSLGPPGAAIHVSRFSVLLHAHSDRSVRHDSALSRPHF
jgi:hypothetical protein